MKYEKVVKGNFIARPNRFVAEVQLGDQIVKVHVKNTGRCRELLLPGATVYLEDFTGRMGSRKLVYSLIGVEKQVSWEAGEKGQKAEPDCPCRSIMINMDSQAPNKVVLEALQEGRLRLPEMESLAVIHPEKTFGDSRFDFYVEDIRGRKGFLEVKGVTLEEEGIASFPDAPTERGVKHVHGLVQAKKQGYLAYVVFVIQMEGMGEFRPNDITHPAFGEALREAEKGGVRVLAYQCSVTADSLMLTSPVPVNLQKYFAKK